MRYTVLASDYDGTLAKDGVVAPQTIIALDRFRESGRSLIMVTGRELSDLEKVFHRLKLFDCIVAENGAVLYWPGTCEKRVLTQAPGNSFTAALKKRRIHPIAVGEVIVATDAGNAPVVLEVIHELGLELQIIFNKDSIMVLPTGVNKMTGLTAALAVSGVSEKDVVGVGDAENDHAFLRQCGLSAAVANALPAVKKTADLTMKASFGAGVVELIDMLLKETPPSPSSSRRAADLPGR